MSVTERFGQQPGDGPDQHPAGSPDGTPGPRAAGRRWRPARRWLRIGATAAAATALVGGAIPAIAAARTSTVTYYACVTNSTGAIKIVGKTTACGAGKHKISWNNAGPRGPRGPAGVVKGYIDNSGGADLTNNSLTVVGTLPLPAGKYMITAKVDAAIGTSNNGDDVVSCDLAASNGNTLDTTGVSLIPALDSAAGYGMTLVGGTSLTVTGNVQVVCANGTGPGGGSAGSVVIMAVPVSKVIQSFG
jgi:hypothetical protein